MESINRDGSSGKTRRAAAGDRKGGAEGAGAPSLGGLNHHVGYLIRRAQLLIFQDFIRTMSSVDIRPAQFSVLTVIARNPGLKQTDVCEALSIKRANLVTMLHELEDRGLATRARASTGDRRSHALYLTDKGEKLLAKLDALALDHDKRLTEALGAENKAQLLRLLGQILERFG